MPKEFYELPDITTELFGNDVKLLSSVSQLYQLELAYLEINMLGKEELVDRGAFFHSVDGNPTKHYNLYERSKFSTGYATHDLYPYRAKFHPQLVKGLLNIIGIQKGETILDPMCGSGTANIEASLMGINAYAADQNPLCRFMAQAKADALTLDPDILQDMNEKADRFFDFFRVPNVSDQMTKINDPEKLKVYNLALLAYMHAYSIIQGGSISKHRLYFKKFLRRYQSTITSLVESPEFEVWSLGSVTSLPGSNALRLDLEDDTIDGVITSPPYSIGSDYSRNDDPQLMYLGYNLSEVKSEMLGLSGKNRFERMQNYLRGMESACEEISRVLKKDKYFILLMGTNTNQTDGIRLETPVKESCARIGLELVKEVIKPIKGARTPPTEESIMFFKNNK